MEHEIEPIRIVDEWEMPYIHTVVYFAVGFHEMMNEYIGMWCEQGGMQFFRHRFGEEQPTRDAVETEFHEWKFARR